MRVFSKIDGKIPDFSASLQRKEGAVLYVYRWTHALHPQVNNSGIMEKEWTKANFDATIATNTTGPVGLIRALEPQLKDRALVINVSSGEQLLFVIDLVSRVAAMTKEPDSITTHINSACRLQVRDLHADML